MLGLAEVGGMTSRTFYCLASLGLYILGAWLLFPILGWRGTGGLFAIFFATNCEHELMKLRGDYK